MSGYVKEYGSSEIDSWLGRDYNEPQDNDDIEDALKCQNDSVEEYKEKECPYCYRGCNYCLML